MRRIFYFLIIATVIVSSISCRQKQESRDLFTVDDVHIPQTVDGISKRDAAKMPELTFETTQYDFGDVVQGERLTCTFKFKNTGRSNLIIYSTEATCGCTTSTPPKAPVRPGESGEIQVTFDSKSQHGQVKKRILVGANTYPVETILYVTANVSVP